MTSQWVALLRWEGLLSPSEPDHLALPRDRGAQPARPPGRVDEYPNWLLALSETFEQLRTDPGVAEIASALGGRGNRWPIATDPTGIANRGWAALASRIGCSPYRLERTAAV